MTEPETITINILPSTGEIQAAIESMIQSGAYFNAMNLAVCFEGPDALEYARQVAQRCSDHRDAQRGE